MNGGGATPDLTAFGFGAMDAHGQMTQIVKAINYTTKTCINMTFPSFFIDPSQNNRISISNNFLYYRRVPNYNQSYSTNFVEAFYQIDKINGIFQLIAQRNLSIS